VAVGPPAQGRRAAVLLARRPPERFDLSQPANQRKLDAVEQLAQLAEEAEVTLSQLAIAFVLNHPAITAALVARAPWNISESEFAAADIRLDEAVLDRITRSSRPGPPSTQSMTPRSTRRWSRRRAGAGSSPALPR
jgi:aryl-alcohol dehydrogenase-like predicted oxidoreductase